MMNRAITELHGRKIQAEQRQRAKKQQQNRCWDRPINGAGVIRGTFEAVAATAATPQSRALAFSADEGIVIMMKVVLCVCSSSAQSTFTDKSTLVRDGHGS
jgi:hypothetical protein